MIKNIHKGGQHLGYFNKSVFQVKQSMGLNRER